MKCTLSQRQKDAVKAMVRASGREIDPKEKAKIGENSYSGFEMGVFAYKSRLGEANSVFDKKGGVWAKKWRRSWNSVPTIQDIREMAKGEYRNNIASINKRVVEKVKKVSDEELRLNGVAMERFYDALDKAKQSSKMTQNVKELLAVENLLIKKVTERASAVYAHSQDFDKDDHIKWIVEKAKEAISNRMASYVVDFHQIEPKENCFSGYRKECIDMRPKAVADLSRAWRGQYGCVDKKRMDELAAKAENANVRDTSWYQTYSKAQKEVVATFNDYFVQRSNIITYAEGHDTHEPDREYNIYTLNISLSPSGEEVIRYDSGENECWSYIPKGYGLESRVEAEFLFGYATNKTKSFITDTRKLKTLEADLSKELKAISKLEEKIRAV